jgi:hypothetical protein
MMEDIGVDAIGNGGEAARVRKMRRIGGWGGEVKNWLKAVEEMTCGGR